VRVYHFLPAQWALDDIAKRRLKISELDQMNDPFESWCVDQEDRQLRKVIQDWKRAAAAQWGMICFSKDWTNPLLWGHYADKHRGMALGFDLDDRGIKPVKYVTERPVFRIPPTKASVDELLFTKFVDWKYEEEWRNWFSFEAREDGHYFYDFNSPTFMPLREVIVGPLCQISKFDIDTALQGYPYQVKITRARLAFRSFRVVENLEGFQC
jgi:hypothetical protein